MQLQLELPPAENLLPKVRTLVAEILASSRPSATELVERVERTLGVKARWDVDPAVRELVIGKGITQDAKDFLRGLLDEGELEAALRGTRKRDAEVHTGIDELLKQGQAYGSSAAFQEMIAFCAHF